MSRRNARSIPGRSTLTATSSPLSASRALCTCAIEAAATGSEKLETRVDRHAPARAPPRPWPRAVGKWRQLVLQHLQLDRQLVAHHVGTGRQDLPELDVGRPERGQRAGRRRHRRIAGIAEPAERPGQRPHRRAEQRRRRTRRARRASRRSAPASRRCGSAGRCCAARAPGHSFQPEWRHATPIVRLRYFACPNPAARIIRRTSPGRGTGGSIPPGTGTRRGRRSPPAPSPG